MSLGGSRVGRLVGVARKVWVWLVGGARGVGVVGGWG